MSQRAADARSGQRERISAMDTVDKRNDRRLPSPEQSLAGGRPRSALGTKRRAWPARRAVAGAFVLLLASSASVRATTPPLITTVDRSVSSHGVTLTVTEVYFDAGWSYIGFDILPTDELRESTDTIIVASSRLTDQFGHEPVFVPDIAYGTWCSELASTGSDPIHCVMTTASFAEPPDVDELVVTWLVDTIWLLNADGITELHSSWTFAFAARYDDVKRGAGVFAIMCRATATPCGPF
jgi:hypothetical protein